MLRIKRLVAFTMAIIICSSFCIIAQGEEWWQGFSQSSSAYAKAGITDWAGETNDTDLYAETKAFRNDYITSYFAGYEVSVDLALSLEDFSSYSNYDCDSQISALECHAICIGKELLLGEPYYEIIAFSSVHEVWVTYYTEFDSDNRTWTNPVSRQDGDTKYLGVSY